MTEFECDVSTSDGLMNTFVVHPDGPGPHPVLLCYMDALGKREELHAMARRFAANGYFVLLPNLYYRQTRDFWLAERVEPFVTQMYALMDSLNAASTEVDTRALLAFLDSQPQADSARVGAVGYCMSGPFVVWAAAQFSGRIRAIASIHGANMATDALDSPHRVAASLPCESYFACAEFDKWAPPADIEQLRLSLASGKAPHRIEWYPGAQHGFVFPTRAGAYDEASAERHWERVLELFGRTLTLAP